jgi:hypothetical protein
MASYGGQLRAFRFWNRAGIVLLLSFLPVLAGVGFLSEGTVIFRALPIGLSIAWFIALAVVYYRIRTFRCPRCAKTATVANWWSPNTRGRKCVHCALELYVEA